MNLLVAASLALLGQSAPEPTTSGQSGPLCAWLDRVKTAAVNHAAFADVLAAAPPPASFGHCFASSQSIFCHRNMTAASEDAEAQATQLAACIGATPQRVRRSTFSPATALVVAADPVRVRFDDTCNERCHVGRILSVDIRRGWEDRDAQ